MAKCDKGFAAASAETLLIEAEPYGVPAEVTLDKVYRFSRVKAQPAGCGGGTLVLAAVLGKLDEMGVWAVLEADPYDRRSYEALYAFYERHGFRHSPDPDNRGLMFRPPGGD
jgi:hypothetical protein